MRNIGFLCINLDIFKSRISFTALLMIFIGNVNNLDVWIILYFAFKFIFHIFSYIHIINKCCEKVDIEIRIKGTYIYIMRITYA